jgi:hypothetical protein
MGSAARAAAPHTGGRINLADGFLTMRKRNRPHGARARCNASIRIAELAAGIVNNTGNSQ